MDIEIGSLDRVVYEEAVHCGPMGQYLPVDSEVGGLNFGDGKSLFFWPATENEMETKRT